MNRARKGAQGERDVRAILEREGFYVTRSAGSKGKADLVASNRVTLLYVQVKTGRASLIKAAQQVCGIPAPDGTLFQVWVKRSGTNEWRVYDALSVVLKCIMRSDKNQKAKRRKPL